MKPIILASASPRRRELLERIGIEIRVLAADIDETPERDEDPTVYALRVAVAKGEHVAAANRGCWVLAADTVVEIGGTPLGKPRDRSQAERMLTALRDTTHRVITAVALVNRGHDPQLHKRFVTTEVIMRDFSDTELMDYLHTSEWQGKAGAYAVQGMAAAFVRELRGSVTNVIGLPLAETIELLANHGIAVPSYCDGTPS